MVVSPSHTPIQPFERLKIYDGLLVDAEGWQLAHSYHSRRQNLHYQALHRGGILHGLGVHPIAPPPNTPSEYRGDRWLQLQPGIAIDAAGNPVVVPQPEPYYLVSRAQSERPLLVYLVISFFDPAAVAERFVGDRLQEDFRLYEKSTPPNPDEIEVCRILLSPDPVVLANARDPFHPLANNIDFRFRPQLGARSQSSLTIAHLDCAAAVPPAEDSIDSELAGVDALLQALPSVYPDLQGQHLGLLRLPADGGDRPQIDLLMANYWQLSALSRSELGSLNQLLTDGATLLVTMDASQTHIDELALVQQHLREAIEDVREDRLYDDIRKDLEGELLANQPVVDRLLQNLRQTLRETLDLDWSSIPTGGAQIDSTHPLRSRPFTFSRFPMVNRGLILLFNWEAVVLAIGDLGTGWGGSKSPDIPRETVREAQELGANLLHFAWARRHLRELQVETSTPHS
ncbi:hypothetical protein [Synechococcus sp. PCC 7336]|uniref:hypothetical protein n=1 Tax=Synechococcus sp. PCC 7336 TaxID=195250 RepID=UPI00034D5947|nr:hypothetical protein [Synechococcus sp. PCC 7336]